MNHADLALHEAHPICFYNAELQQKAEFQSRIDSLQQRALARKEFEVWYQPKYDLVTRKCIGAEALVRWRSREPGFGTIPIHPALREQRLHHAARLLHAEPRFIPEAAPS